MAKIFMIGGGGFIGMNLAAHFIARGDTVTLGVRTPAPDTQPSPDVTFDIAAPGAIEACIDRIEPDIVVHLASTLLPSSSEGEYLAERRNLIDQMIGLTRLLGERKIKFVYFSSGGTVYGISGADMLRETDPCAPISYYGQAKLEAELLIQFAGRTLGLDYMILRPSNPFGLRQRRDGVQGLIAVAFGRMADGRTLTIWGDGKATRDYIYIDDLVTSVAHLIDRGEWNETFNVGSGIGTSTLDVIAMVEKAGGRRIDIRFQPSRTVDVSRVVLDIGKMLSVGVPVPMPAELGIALYARQLAVLER